MPVQAVDRTIHTLLKTIFANRNWNEAVERRFQTFHNRKFTSNQQFDTDTLLKGLPYSKYLSDPRNKDILSRFWGLNQEAGTLDSIGQSYGITRERVRQIKEKATRILKHPARLDIIRNNLEEMGFFF